MPDIATGQAPLSIVSNRWLLFSYGVKFTVVITGLKPQAELCRVWEPKGSNLRIENMTLLAIIQHSLRDKT